MNNLISHWSSPANIAFIKYWGKRPGQLPCNPSLSMTLEACRTEMSIELVEKKSHNWISSFEFEGKENPKFAVKIEKFLQSQHEWMNWARDFNLVIKSVNTFPHSAGVASSASSMSALALNLCTLKTKVTKRSVHLLEFLRETSVLSRLASGSACRSVYPGLVSWGERPESRVDSDLWATPVLNYGPLFKDLCDSVLVVSAKEKKVSSTAGHSQMGNHPYAHARYQSARDNYDELELALKSDDWDRFAAIVEHEAMSLHAMMMTAKPTFTLLAPASIAIIQKIQQWREREALPVCFTIDAGPNIHVLYPQSVAQRVKGLIERELVPFCESGVVIHDKMGQGPRLVGPAL